MIEGKNMEIIGVVHRRMEEDGKVQDWIDR